LIRINACAGTGAYAGQRFPQSRRIIDPGQGESTAEAAIIAASSWEDDMAAAEAGFYNDKVVRQFAVMTVVWGIVGMLVGVLIAAELYWPDLTAGISWLSYGRLRPLHTNAVIFAFGGCALFATSLYIVQRTSHVRLISDGLAAFVFWGWQLVIAAAAVTLPLGYTQGKEYAELEWPIDILITLVWVAYAVLFFGTIVKRRVKHIYVANWFFGAYIITIALLHIVNNVWIPAGGFKSYTVYSGTVDAMVQWWYGHNAVGFFLTAGFLGMMYYFVPKQAGRPIYSYRLSIVHFWALIAIYMWAGPHHLQYTALPDWAQSLGMVFSLVLLAPSWGGAINGIMTLSGVWHKLRTDPILKFLIVSLSFYMMSTFEGPMMSIKTVNSLSHYTDWTIGHVHSGALGWVAYISFGAIYCLVPWLWNRKLYSLKLVNWHFWISTIGIVLYITSMWVSGILQGLMWRAYTSLGFLEYSFVETVEAMHPFYVIRALGGFLFLCGALVMVWNLWKTVNSAEEAETAGIALAPAE
jgi:cytochrome c oxidase cbb3-type subunit 1